MPLGIRHIEAWSGAMRRRLRKAGGELHRSSRKHGPALVNPCGGNSNLFFLKFTESDCVKFPFRALRFAAQQPPSVDPEKFRGCLPC